MFETALSTLDKFTPEILVILTGLLVITTTLFLWLWFANRRSYNLLKHQLPASVVKDYLDSVIQNSNALKSALFRGGGAEVDGIASIPVVRPVSGGGESVATHVSDGNLREQLQQKLAELAALQSQLSAAQNAKRDLEKSLTGAQERIRELEALLAQSGTGDDGALVAQVSKLTAERDELRDKLREYEIIEDDLANLKRLQQENEQLKRSLGASGVSGGSTAEVTTPDSAAVGLPDTVSDLFEEVPRKSEDDATSELEEFLAAGSEEPAHDPEKDVEAALTQANAPAKAASKEKTPEDLLSEFEKMLG